MRPLRIKPILTAEEATLAISILCRQNTVEALALAKKLKAALHHDSAQHKADLEEEAEVASLRACRAENATLTVRQAECLAALRAGQGVRARFYQQWSGSPAKWAYGGSSMGGAIHRMVDRLIEDGLLDNRCKITKGGLDRLARWEAANAGKFEWPTTQTA